MKVSILGSGDYGSALTTPLNRNDIPVKIYARSEKSKSKCENSGMIDLNKTTVVTDMALATEETDIIIIAVTSAGVKDIVKQLKPLYNNQIICVASKGIDPESGLFMNEVVEKELDTDKVCILSGPSFAEDVAKERPLIVTIAGDEKLTQVLKNCFNAKDFMVELSSDVIGTACWGSLKNVMAIGVGIMQGQKNTNFNLISGIYDMSFAETKLISNHLGGKESSSLKHSGFADFALTCGVGFHYKDPEVKENFSRNKRFGMYVGKGYPIDQALIKVGTVEGYSTLKGLEKLIETGRLDLNSVRDKMRKIYIQPDSPVEGTVVGSLIDIVLKGKSPRLLVNYLFPDRGKEFEREKEE